VRKYSPVKYLYHYTKARTLVDHILPDGRLLLNTLAATNDPREYKYRGFVVRSIRLFTQDEYIAIVDTANKMLGSHARFISFCCDSNCDAQSSDFRGYMHPRMWAQYAEGHTGACLILDRAKLTDSFLSSNLGDFRDAAEVTYCERPLRGSGTPNYDTIDISQDTVQCVLQHMKDNARGLFFRKNVDWRDEAEFRLLRVQHQATPTQNFLNINAAIAGIVLGTQFPEALHQPVIGHARELAICVGQIQWKDGNGYIGNTPYAAIDSHGHYSDRAYFFTNTDFYANDWPSRSYGT